MSNILSNQKNFKAIVAFGVSASIDKFIYKSPNITHIYITNILIYIFIFILSLYYLYIIFNFHKTTTEPIPKTM